MSKPQILTPIAALAAVLVAFFIVAFPADAKLPSNPDLRVATACAPLSSSQAAQVGDTQTCRVRVQNWSGGTLTGIEVAHNSTFTLTAISATSTGGAAPVCTVADGCAPFSLTNYTQAVVFYTYTRTAPAIATLTLGCAESPTEAKSCSKEQASLP